MLDQFKQITQLDAPIFDAKIHRFGKKDHGWYVAHEWNYNGNSYRSIKLGSWNGTIQEQTLKSWDHKAETTEFRKKINQHLKESEAKLKAEKFENYKKCAEKWWPIFKNSSINPEHEYLSHKKIKAFNSRLDVNYTLLIPAYNANGFVGVQRIFLDPETKQFVKKFSYGIQIQGAFCPLSPFKNAPLIYVSEGFATAASIQMAFPEIPSICAFNAGNLDQAIQSIRLINPTCKIVIAADKDLTKTGERAAKKCQENNKEVIFKLPVLTSDNWTDFNDLHCFESLEKVKEQLAIDSTDFETVTFLGYNGDDYFYTSSSNKQVSVIKVSGHSKLGLLGIAPEEYWKKRYGFVDDETGKVITPWSQIASDLMKLNREKGVFDTEKVRGAGVWKDQNFYVINNGEKLSTEVENSSYFYQFSKFSGHKLTQEISREDALSICAAFKNLRYKNKMDYVYICAFIVQSHIFTVLPWRFHIWITGEKGCGKSQILKWINSLTINSLLTNNATAAGIVQTLKSDARVTIYDESEASNERMGAVIELARQMNSPGDFKTIRGTSGGKSVVNNTDTVFLMGSIQTGVLNEADRSRFFLIEMNTTKGQSQDEYLEISEVMEGARNLKEKLFTLCYNQIPNILENYSSIKEELRKRHYESRQADQLASALACFIVLEKPEKISKEEISRFIDMLDLGETQYIKSGQETDQGDCLESILEVVLSQNDGHTVASSIKTIDENATDMAVMHRLLSSVGIRYEKKDRMLYISKNNALKNKIKEFPDYLNVLKRHESFVDYKNIRIVGTVKKCVCVDLKKLLFD